MPNTGILIDLSNPNKYIITMEKLLTFIDNGDLLRLVYNIRLPEYQNMNMDKVLYRSCETGNLEIFKFILSRESFPKSIIEATIKLAYEFRHINILNELIRQFPYDEVIVNILNKSIEEEDLPILKVFVSEGLRFHKYLAIERAIKFNQIKLFILNQEADLG